MGKRRALTVIALGTFLILARGGRVSAEEHRTEKCPPKGNPYVEVEDIDKDGKRTRKPNIEMPFEKGEDINGDGKKDVLMLEKTDVVGNRDQSWCVQQGATAQQFFYAFIPKNGPNAGKRLWYGGCFFQWGVNTHLISSEIVKGGADDGKFKEMLAVYNFNKNYGADFKNDPKGTEGKKFWHFNNTNIVAINGKNRKDKTTGKWQKNNKGDWEYMVTNPVMQGQYTDPPGLPQKLDGDPPTDNHGGVNAESVLVIANVENGPNWSYSLFPNPSFSEAVNVPLSPGVTIQPGDEFVVTGSGIAGPFVSGAAATSPFGGWVVQDYDSAHVTFRATTSADVETDLPFGSFGFYSDFPVGIVRWAYAGTEIGDYSTTIGPAMVVQQRK